MKYQLNNVNLVYEMDKEGGTAALSDVSLGINAKGIIGILGPSGSGKSSLLYTMAGLKHPTSGQILCNDRDITSMGASQLATLRREEFGFVFQQHFLINYMTVLENVLVPLNKNTIETRKKAKYLLKRLGIEHHANKYPHQLSGGQRQRVAISRALMNNPKVIFGDEPTAALDKGSASEVMELLSEYTKDTLVIIVTHDASILENAKSLIYVRDGRIEKVAKQEVTR
ncbi:MAG: ABC transporter ATP-binding protein [Clostridiales bacterium]|nr:ABC transporter ATP-binding protein [Clostridiales bacterium]